MTLPLPERVDITKGVLFTDLGDQGVLLHLKDELYFELNEVGVRTWQLLHEFAEPAVVLKHLLAQYEVEETTLRKDLSELIGAMKDANLLTIL
jgi:hypothetical protein